MGNLSDPGRGGILTWTATDYQTWPRMFDRFWKLFGRPSGARLRNAIAHYVSSSAVSQNSQSATYAIVPTRSTLEALVKWWNDLEYDFQFGGDDDTRFIDLLILAIEKAKLGRDSERRIDLDEVKLVAEQGTRFRNTIDHGSTGIINDKELGYVITNQWYLHNLARLLISAKLGVRDTHTRGQGYSPKFM